MSVVSLCPGCPHGGGDQVVPMPVVSPRRCPGCPHGGDRVVPVSRGSPQQCPPCPRAPSVPIPGTPPPPPGGPVAGPRSRLPRKRRRYQLPPAPAAATRYRTPPAGGRGAARGAAPAVPGSHRLSRRRVCPHGCPHLPPRPRRALSPPPPTRQVPTRVAIPATLTVTRVPEGPWGAAARWRRHGGSGATSRSGPRPGRTGWDRGASTGRYRERGGWDQAAAGSSTPAPGDRDGAATSSPSLGPRCRDAAATGSAEPALGHRHRGDVTEPAPGHRHWGGRHQTGPEVPRSGVVTVGPGASRPCPIVPGTSSAGWININNNNNKPTTGSVLNNNNLKKKELYSGHPPPLTVEHGQVGGGVRPVQQCRKGGHGGP